MRAEDVRFVTAMTARSRAVVKRTIGGGLLVVFMAQNSLKQLAERMDTAER